ncbi:MAG: 4Fe-4S ferredoxin, partial [Sulfobacillus thermotolerans]|nr:4Fe-4S ferredoxin [Sulfobacillus thermotolerans]
TFGDLEDPDSAVAHLVAERQGFVLLPELGARPAIHYLPRRHAPGIVDPETIDRVLGEGS